MELVEECFFFSLSMESDNQTSGNLFLCFSSLINPLGAIYTFKGGAEINFANTCLIAS